MGLPIQLSTLELFAWCRRRDALCSLSLITRGTLGQPLPLLSTSPLYQTWSNRPLYRSPPATYCSVILSGFSTRFPEAYSDPAVVLSGLRSHKAQMVLASHRAEDSHSPHAILDLGQKGAQTVRSTTQYSIILCNILFTLHTQHTYIRQHQTNINDQVLKWYTQSFYIRWENNLNPPYILCKIEPLIECITIKLVY